MKQDTYFIQESYENICESFITYIKAFGIPKSSGDTINALEVLDILNRDIDNRDETVRITLNKYAIEVVKKIDEIIIAFDKSAESFEKSMKARELFDSSISSSIGSAGAVATFGALSAKKDIKTLAAEMNAAKKKYDDIYVTGPDAAQRKQKAYQEYETAKKTWEAEYYKQRGLNPDGSAKQSDTAITQKTAASSGTKTQVATKTTTTQQSTAKTVASSQSTGGTTAKSGTTSELEKKLKAKEAQLEQAEMEKKKADIAKTEAQDKANRVAAEKQEEEKRRHMAEAEAENAKEEAAKLKTENEELRKKIDDTPGEVTPQSEPTPTVEPTPEPAPEATPAAEPQPEPTPQAAPAAETPSAQPTQQQVYTQTPAAEAKPASEPSVEVKPSETGTGESTTTPIAKPSTENPKPTTTTTTTTLPNPNAGGGSSTSKSSGGSSVVPIAVGLGAAVAGGLGIKALHDHRQNSKFDDQNDDSVTNGNRFWTDEDPNVVHTEQDLFNDTSTTEDVSYQAVENSADTNNDTWNIEESELSDDNTFDLLSENN